MSTCSNNRTHEDRLSDLPECVLSNILSRLPIKEALRTNLLSRDWKYKFTCIGDIDVGRVYKSCCIRSFERFMGTMLELYQEIRVSGFRVQTSKSLLPCTLNDYPDTQDSRFISLRIKRLIIVVSSKQDRITLHKRHYDPSVELKVPLSRNFVVGAKNWFPSLKHLYLNGEAGSSIRVMNEKSLETCRLIFPVLKTFQLKYFEFLNVKFVEIIAPKLTEFSACGLDESNGCVIKIRAPKLKKFASASCPLNKFVLHTPYLSTVVLCHDFVPSEFSAMQVITSLQGAPRLKELKLSSSLVEAFVKWKKVHLLSSFKRLRILWLCSSVSTTDLMELLQGTPYLNSLHLWKSGNSILDLIKLFLEKAKKLEKVIIRPTVGSMTRDEICHWRSTLGPEWSNRIDVPEKF